jgi:Holliday junction resolvase RusA-like endonuclease
MDRRGEAEEEAVRFVVVGRPATKSNHQSIMRGKKGRPFVMQSAQYRAWEELAVAQLRGQARGRTFSDWITRPMNLRAIVYRDRNIGDLGNYLKAICDVLERAGIVENDRLIMGFDGSRLLIDRENPRVEVELSPLADEDDGFDTVLVEDVTPERGRLIAAAPEMLALLRRIHALDLDNWPTAKPGYIDSRDALIAETADLIKSIDGR